MKLWHCSKCHHEWEGPDEPRNCDWCGADNPRVLANDTPLAACIRRHFARLAGEVG